MDFQCKIKNIKLNTNNEVEFSLITSNKTTLQGLEELKLSDKTLDLEIKKHRNKRSNDSNSYLWYLCEKIANKITDEDNVITKLDVYKDAIKQVGQFEILPMKDESVSTFIEAWKHNGLGWVCEVIGQSKWKNYTNICTYYGSSIYDSSSMSRLLNFIIQEAHEWGIETLEDQEINKMIEEWENKKNKKVD